MKYLEFEEFAKLSKDSLREIVTKHNALRINGPINYLMWDVYPTIYSNGEMDVVAKRVKNNFVPKNKNEEKLVSNIQYFIEYKFYNPENVIFKENVKYAVLLDEV